MYADAQVPGKGKRVIMRSETQSDMLNNKIDKTEEKQTLAYNNEWMKPSELAKKVLGDKEAIEVYKQAIKINPEDAKAHFGLGVAYHVLNDRDSALKEYKILKTLDLEKADELLNYISK